MLTIENKYGFLKLNIHRGHILDWTSKRHFSPILWMSPLAVDFPAKPIRGGVPICWPWFGTSPSDHNFPAHGIARISSWELIGAIENLDGETNVELRLDDSALDAYEYYKGLKLILKITLGETLKICLETVNTSNARLSYSEGLHTYFAVSDIEKIKITGLEGQSFLDLMNNNRETCDNSSIKFDRETGRIYVNSESECIIEDANFNRKIRVKKWGSKTTAIWNPWATGIKNFNDMEAEAWRAMVCVESANAYVNRIDLDGKDTHTLATEYILEA